MALILLKALLILGQSQFLSLNSLGTDVQYEAALPTAIIAGPAVSTLYLDKTRTIFSINLANDSDDLYFYFGSEYCLSWVAIGTGHEMKHSLMLIMYPTKNGSSLSPLFPELTKLT